MMDFSSTTSCDTGVTAELRELQDGAEGVFSSTRLRTPRCEIFPEP
jgi:hypothetical protein